MTFDRVGWDLTLRPPEEMADGWMPECPIRLRVNGDPSLPGGGSNCHEFLMTTEFLADLVAQGRSMQLRLGQLARERALKEIAASEEGEEILFNTPDTRPDVWLLERLRRALVDL